MARQTWREMRAEEKSKIRFGMFGLTPSEILDKHIHVEVDHSGNVKAGRTTLTRAALIGPWALLAKKGGKTEETVYVILTGDGYAKVIERKGKQHIGPALAFAAKVNSVSHRAAGGES